MKRHRNLLLPICIVLLSPFLIQCERSKRNIHDSSNSSQNNPFNSELSEKADNPSKSDPAISGPTSGNVVASYFVEWGVYPRDYHANMVPADKLTHLLYGFIAICGPNDSLEKDYPNGHAILEEQCQDQEDFTVVIHDKFAALEKPYPGEIKGNFGQLKKLKESHPNLKVLPSIGGWTLSDPFFELAKDPMLRARFVKSSIDFLKQYQIFDGLDIDWEFPGGDGSNESLGSEDDRDAYTYLMKDLREALDKLSQETGRNYELTSAVGSAPKKIKSVNYKEAAQYIDYVFAMTYDFYGAWNNELGHHTGLNSVDQEIHEDFSSAAAINNLLEAGVPANKLVMGFTMYGRGWTGVSGYKDNNPFTGVGNGPHKGTWEEEDPITAGVLDYKDIETNYLGGSEGTGIDGYSYFYDEKAEAPYLWNMTTGGLISYENPRSIKAKAAFAKSKNLAGMFAWSLDGDTGILLDAAVNGIKN
ncbi:glycoside hydrolase family 18 protein [Pseudobacteriovorax antillogorgiicola]|uniref:chitinase n=1 Tax=Pseudobacteriovorax antillogorgiicola TaxID=1513793 RepID=A0A1Y6CA89_9BACT|nr:glycoside hydrolase family 18 protein [Pseudobacteriovorax antillogorgiicola]TCS49110.1 GH18 family chitinase [Pseudobacteriovorax antillogorgiicola]SMF51626.1 Chitinase, GH18 family [Pseudobacteriovorax antillogorgiicola]